MSRFRAMGWHPLRREVPVRRRRRRTGELAYRAWLALITMLAALAFWGTVMLALGCGRGGAAPCMPQPSVTNTGPSGSGPARCEYRR